MYIQCFDFLIQQENNVLIFEDNTKQRTGKDNEQWKNAIFAVFFRNSGLVRAIHLDEQMKVIATSPDKLWPASKLCSS